ncbi:MAG: hypothetical protein ACI8SE_001583 [Bacteroidia bacterium]|jgi:hypothetical protein
MADQSSHITEYIQQRPPFVMVDKLLSAENGRFESTFQILSDNILVEQKTLTVYGLIENIAQTASAGLHASMIRLAKTTGGTGVLGGVSKLSVKNIPPVGSNIRTTVRIITELGKMIKIHGSTYLNKECLMECEMSIVVVN